MGCNCSEVPRGGQRTDFQYAVKVVCGSIPEGDKESPLPPGDYFTKVNIHNFSRCDCVTFRWKVALGHPRLRVGPISDFADATLCADEAMEIDCKDMARRFGDQLPKTGPKSASHHEGWVVIESPVELDIVAVYGVAATKNGGINSFHTERVKPRCIPICDDFLLDISTGVSAWEYKAPGGSAYELATLSQALSGWADASPGSLWIVLGESPVAGEYTFRLPFKLCSGFRMPNLAFNLMVDDSASVFLNGHPVPPTAASATTPTSYLINTYFKAGHNELTIVVSNVKRGSPVGIALHGSLEVANGLCAGEPMPLLACPEVCCSLETREFWFNPLIGVYVDIQRRIDGPGCEGVTVGSEGNQARRRAERLQMSLSGAVPPGTSIEYQVFTRNVPGTPIGWSAMTSTGFAGVVGPNRAITAIRAVLVNAPVNCRIRYRVCTRRQLINPDLNPIWSDWFYDGAIAGSVASMGFPTRFPPIIAMQAEIV